MARRGVLDRIAGSRRPRRRRCLLAVISTGAIMAPVALQAATAIASPLVVTGRATGSAGTAFSCSVPSIFLAQLSPTQLYDSLYGAGKTTFSKIGKTHDWDYNAIGYDATDKYLYGISLPTGDKGYPAGHLLQIGSAGDIADWGLVSGDAYLSRNGVHNGAFDDSGHFWVGDTGDKTVDEISLTAPPKVQRAVALKGSWAPSDFTFASGYLWGMAGDGTAVKVYRLDLSSGQVSSFLAPKGIASTKVFGAAWTYGNGNLGFDANSTGALYEVSVAKASASRPTLALVSAYSGPVGNINDDGAACVPTPADLSITATGPATATVGSGLSWELTVKNLGPGISSGYVIDDSPPTGVTAVASSSPGCQVAGAAVTCDEGELRVGDSASYTISGDAPSTGNVCVTDTATVTGNESDPRLKNNTASVKTCTLRASPSLAKETPTPAAGTVGGSFSDSVTLDGGYEPTGTITFDLYGADTCVGTSSYSTTATVKGDGSYSAVPMTLETVGTYYWQARYSGDAANTPPAATPCASGKATVAQAAPSLSSETPTPASATVGTSFADAVTLASGYDPTGTVTFDLYGADTCTGTPIDSDTVTVSGNSKYTSPADTVTTAGDYWWQASYSGDASNQAPAATPCRDGAVSVTKAAPTLEAETPTPASATVGTSVADGVTLASGYDPSGTITFDLYRTDTCTGTPVYSSTATVTGDGIYSAVPETLTVVGSYYWQASYSGDGDNTPPAATPCASGKLTVAQAAPTLSSETPAPGSAVVGSSFADAVTLASGYDPTGTITFDLYGADTCTGTPMDSETVTVSGNNSYTAPSETLTSAGDYWWQASYSGDADNAAPATTPCGDGAVSVTKAGPTLQSETLEPASGTVGSDFADEVTLAGGYSETGTVTFDVYDVSTCAGSPLATVTMAAKGNGPYETPALPFDGAGTYWWQVSFAGDANNHAAASTPCADGELSVVKATPALSSETPTPSAADVGSGFSDEVTLSGGYGPSGTVTFNLYSSDTCSGTPLDTDSVDVSGDGTYNSSASTRKAVGTYWWQASYSGDGNNEATSTPCADGKFSVVKASPTLGSEGPSPASAVVGSSFGDGVTISAGYSPTGTITFGLYGNSACSGTPVTSLSATVDGNGSDTSSSVATVTTAGSYWWQANYSGDSRNNTASTPCGDGAFSVTQAAPSLSSEVPTPSSPVAGADETDYVNLAGGYGPTGTITFDLYESSTCTGTVVATDTSDVDGDQDSIASSATVPPGAGDYWWEASYSGDTNNAAASTPCTEGAFSVTKASPELTGEVPSPTQAPVGSTFSSSIALEPGYAPTGTIEFNLYTGTACTGTPLYSASVPVDGSGIYAASITIEQASVYTWTEVYSGDENNNGYNYDLDCYFSDPITADRFVPALVQVPILAATDLWLDEVTVSGGYSPSGTLTVDLYEGSSCTGTPVESQPVSIAGNGTYISPAPFYAVNSDYYTFGVSYPGDGNNEPVSTCTGGTFYNSS